MPETSKNNGSNRPETLRNKHLGGDKVLHFPSVRHPHEIQLIFKDYDYNKFISTISKGSTVSSDNTDFNRIKKFGFNPTLNATPVASEYTSIVLPFPRNLSDITGVNSTPFERSFLFERLTSAVASVSDLSASDVLKTVGNIASSALSAARGVGTGEINVEGMISEALTKTGLATTAAAQAAQYLSRSFLPSDFQSQLAQFGGAIANPLTSLQFTGVSLKDYSFSWDLFPSNQKDSELIKEIVRTLKNKALPRVGSMGEFDGLNRTLLKYPGVVIINLLGVDETHFKRFKPAMLTNVTAQYGSEGNISMLKGGKPSLVNLTLSFTELNIHTAEDYDLPSGDNNDTIIV